MKNICLGLLLLTLSFSPIIAQTKTEKKQMKEEKAMQDYTATLDLINSGNYQFEADWAITQNGKRISLISSPNYLRMANGEADIDLPYFGVAHSPTAGYGNGGGIVFKGSVDDYKEKTDDKKQKIAIHFSGKAKSDRYSFKLTVFKNRNANLTVTSNNRSGITYDGKISVLEKKD